MYNALDIAKYIICYAYEKGVTITNLKLQKLLYYAQAWYLVNFGTALFDDKIEAWQFGPVVPSVYNEFKSFGRNPIELTDYECTNIISDETCINYLDEFCEHFMKYSSTDLVSMTHNEEPWKKAYLSDNKEIKPEILKEYYSKL